MLQSWFANNCDGEWEHQRGVKIETIDNPGWSVHIDLKGKAVEAVKFDRVERGSGGDWIVCDVRDGVFEGFGGPGNLVDILDVFVSWVYSGAKQGDQVG